MHKYHTLNITLLFMLVGQCHAGNINLGFNSNQATTSQNTTESNQAVNAQDNNNSNGDNTIYANYSQSKPSQQPTNTPVNSYRGLSQADIAMIKSIKSNYNYQSAIPVPDYYVYVVRQPQVETTSIDKNVIIPNGVSLKNKPQLESSLTTQDELYSVKESENIQIKNNVSNTVSNKVQTSEAPIITSNILSKNDINFPTKIETQDYPLLNKDSLGKWSNSSNSSIPPIIVGY